MTGSTMTAFLSAWSAHQGNTHGVASALGIKVASVRMRAHRARKAGWDLPHYWKGREHRPQLILGDEVTLDGVPGVVSMVCGTDGYAVVDLKDGRTVRTTRRGTLPDGSWVVLR